MTLPTSSHAVVRMAIAPLLAEPSVSSAQVSQRLAGHVVEVLDEQGDWIRVRGADEYEGWMHAGYVTRAPRPGARQSGGFSRISLGCVAATSDGARRALPLGALLAPEETVESGEAVAATEQAARFPRDASAITRSAREFFDGTPYQWGGITTWGADCSGFVQSLYWLHGLALPRDASQQASAGERVRRELQEIGPAELAFFSDRPDRAVTHVGIGLGGGRLAHVAVGRGGYAIERLTAKRDAYVANLRERFLFVQRVV
jgi:cell wall-associated NlpC family hydrolase